MLVDHEAEAAPPDPVVRDLLQQPLDSTGPTEGNILFRLAVSMRAHGRGGLIVVIPKDSDDWKKSVVHPIGYEISPPFSGLADLVRNTQGDHEIEMALARTIEEVAGLTAVDGAVVVTSDYEVAAFGVKLTRRSDSPHVSDVVVTESVINGERRIAEPTRLGGTRHLAAAQFVHDQREAIAIVASQDGRVAVLKWSDMEDRVHVHRFDALLL
jgi:DNA integrity scanning protein DisA with diadenylate cyclase activity